MIDVPPDLQAARASRGGGAAVDKEESRVAAPEEWACFIVICIAETRQRKSYADYNSSTASKQQIYSSDGHCNYCLTGCWRPQAWTGWLGRRHSSSLQTRRTALGALGVCRRVVSQRFRCRPGRRGLLTASHIWGCCQDVLCRHEASIEAGRA